MIAGKTLLARRGDGPTSESRPVVANVAARIAALASLAVATLIVARAGGPPAVGIYALLRVLPGLAGVLASCGLPSASAFFLAGPTTNDRRLRPTIVGIALSGSVLGTVAWMAGAPVLHRLFFPSLSTGLVAMAGLAVLTQLPVANAKGCCQGSDDLAGANWIIMLEELVFVAAYPLLRALGVHGHAAVLAALVVTDVATASWGWARLARRGFFRHRARPSLGLARRVCGFGLRGQLGGFLSLLNLRLDFVVLGALAGAGAVGTYAIASKFAELLRLAPMAYTYVLYPRFARTPKGAAVAEARVLIRRVGVFTAAAAVPLGLAAVVLLPFFYGDAFRPAIVPTQILLFGLAGEGLAGVITGFLYGRGRPGLNSLSVGVGLVVTVILDVALVPRWGAIGAATASAAAYLATTATLLVCFWSLNRAEDRPVEAGEVTVAVPALATVGDGSSPPPEGT